MEKLTPKEAREATRRISLVCPCCRASVSLSANWGLVSVDDERAVIRAMDARALGLIPIEDAEEYHREEEMIDGTRAAYGLEES